jgi:putative endonuclease
VEYLQKKRLCYFRNQLDFPKAEIDIIAKRKHPSRCRSQNSFFFRLWFTAGFCQTQKIQLLVKAVDAYVNEKGLDINVRFDIIAIHKESKSLQSNTS